MSKPQLHRRLLSGIAEVHGANAIDALTEVQNNQPKKSIVLESDLRYTQRPDRTQYLCPWT